MSRPRIAERILAGLSSPSERSSTINAALADKSVPKVIADEPARYFWEESETEHWDQPTEFRNVAPPFDAMWIEWRAPKFINSEEYGVIPWLDTGYSQQGALVFHFDHAAMPEHVRDKFPAGKCRWVAMIDVYTQYGDDEPYLGWTFYYGVAEDGSIVETKRGGFYGVASQATRALVSALEVSHSRSSQTGGGHLGRVLRTIADTPPGRSRREALLTTASEYYCTGMNVCMLTLYFMHAKGTELKTQHVPDKVRKKRSESGRPSVSFKVLDVGLPMRRSLAQAKAEGAGLKHALRAHLRRGNFAVYSPEKPHVSGFVGSMWRRPTVVSGEKKDLEADRTYRVKPDAGAQEREERGLKNPGDEDRDEARASSGRAPKRSATERALFELGLAPRASEKAGMSFVQPKTWQQVFPFAEGLDSPVVWENAEGTPIPAAGIQARHRDATVECKHCGARIKKAPNCWEDAGGDAICSGGHDAPDHIPNEWFCEHCFGWWPKDHGTNCDCGARVKPGDDAATMADEHEWARSETRGVCATCEVAKTKNPKTKNPGDEDRDEARASSSSPVEDGIYVSGPHGRDGPFHEVIIGERGSRSSPTSVTGRDFNDVLGGYRGKILGSTNDNRIEFRSAPGCKLNAWLALGHGGGTTKAILDATFIRLVELPEHDAECGCHGGGHRCPEHGGNPCTCHQCLYDAATGLVSENERRTQGQVTGVIAHDGVGETFGLNANGLKRLGVTPPLPTGTTLEISWTGPPKP